MAVSVIPTQTEAEIEAARVLFREYDASLDTRQCTTGIEEEIRGLPANYAALFLARDADGRTIGCVGMRPAKPAVCELKRLYVRPAGRGHGAGRALVEEALAFARNAGCREIVLDTLPSMEAAVALYRRLGFEQVRACGGGCSLSFRKEVG